MDRKQKRGSWRRPGSSSKKRKFVGNRYSDKQTSDFASTSAAKLKKSNDDSFDVHCDPTVTYCILQFALVFSNLQTMLKCKRCNKDISFTKYGQRGLGFKLCVRCSCGDTYINSCPMIGTGYEINRRFIFVMRMIGIGINGIKIFCALMDLGQTINIAVYYKIIDSISISVKTIFDIVTRKAATEEKDSNLKAGNPENEFVVSGDGSWSRRGFSSLLGIVSVIGKYSNKILDIAIRSSICKACEYWKRTTDNTDDFEAWYEDHEENCDANHEGSAGKMEVDGIVEMFQRSEEKHGVKYAYYIGDGDSKTFTTLLDVSPYGDNFIVQKRECILHVKKRMYRRANEARKKLIQIRKTKKQIEGKSTKKKSSASTSKRVKLTKKLIMNLSTYYGLAIRRHPDSVEDMKNAVWATYYHKISTDEAPQHTYCPKGADSWCTWHQHAATRSSDLYRHPPALDEEAQEMLQPIYEELASEDLLKRCLGANTQNNNESFHSCVWCLVPKHIFCGKKILEIATFIAACIYNEGFQPILKIMEVMGVIIGSNAVRFAETRDETRIRIADRRSSKTSKEARIARREARSADEDKFEITEGILYGAGIDD